MDIADLIGTIAGGENSKSDLMSVAKDLLSGSGSNSTLDSIMGALKENGQEDVVQSWVSNSDNLPLSAGALKKALGSDTLGNISESLGISKDKLPSILVSLLPLLIDKLTPEGKAPSGGSSLMSTGMSLLKGFL
jgi:uncharacterized protein YidB (DUF937 family)